ncbi:hypothetical protein CR513_17301, partial [Mucuna pruriens]
MDILENRRWMYRRLDANKRWTNKFTEEVHEFLQFAIAYEKFQLQGEILRSPCNKCKCLVFKFVDEVGYDLYEQGFMPNYYWWTNHGEQLPQFPPPVVEGSYYASGEQREEFNPYEQLIMDHVGPSIALSLKSDYNMSEGCSNCMVQLMGETMPESNIMVTNLYHARKSRGVQKNISMKKMWYFPLIPRLKRLYSSIATASHMRWHSDNERDPTFLCHPSNAEAWKHFDRLHLEFSKTLGMSD